MSTTFPILLLVQHSRHHHCYVSALSTKSHYRSYTIDVVDRLKELCSSREDDDDDDDADDSRFEMIQYGALSHNPTRYPLVAAKSRGSGWGHQPCMLVTGGVHGSERSGIEGCLEFLEQQQQQQQRQKSSSFNNVNLLIVPCVSPWAYEWGTRCQANRKDPNRSFSYFKNNNLSSASASYQTEEAQALMTFLRQSLNVPRWTCHLDLHETRPGGQDQGGAFDILLGQGDNDSVSKAEEEWMMSIDPFSIPQGVYLVVDEDSQKDVQQQEFQRAVLDSIQRVLPVLQGSNDNSPHQSLFERIQDGVLPVPTKALGLCSSTTEATFLATTEVCRSVPENDRDVIYRQAQISAITGALDFLRYRGNNPNHF